ncbi:holo-ACP synthase [Pedobacter arcticus]|uniref:holo-ACP synthase n=1 Tax=Pedobacter arcticus TaxID=752140 RepID=UPI00037C30CC|nr:holo-ACP synthase [Pedobacter arcticus]
MKTLVDELNNNQEFAVGNDVVFLPTFSHSFNPLFQNKVYTEQEIAYCEQFDEPLLRYASTWAAKEAVYKAIKQIESKPLPFKKIEILREKIAGKPTVNLPHSYVHFKISLSISHDGDYIWAVAVLKLEKV